MTPGIIIPFMFYVVVSFSSSYLLSYSPTSATHDGGQDDESQGERSDEPTRDEMIPKTHTKRNVVKMTLGETAKTTKKNRKTTKSTPVRTIGEA